MVIDHFLGLLNLILNRYLSIRFKILKKRVHSVMNEL